MKRFFRRWLPDTAINSTRHLRHQVRMARVRLRLRDSRIRLMPSFLIIGAMKAGTTSLFRYLCEHPSIFSPVVKEIHYFNFNWSRSAGWYAAHFPVARGKPEYALTGEASPGYLVHPLAPWRARERIPDARIIVLLRDPVQRALSHYFHERRIGRESRPAHEALFAPESFTKFTLTPDQEGEWYAALNGGRRRQAKAAALIAQCPMHKAYITHSRYVDHLPAWFEAFGQERILTLRAEDLFADPGGELDKAVEFLGLDALNKTDLPAHNIGKYPDSVSPEVIARLKDEFSGPNRRLFELIGKDQLWDV